MKDIVKSVSIVGWNLKDAGCGEPTNLQENRWSNELKLYKRLYMGISLHNKSRPDNYTESGVVNVTDGCRKQGKLLTKNWLGMQKGCESVPLLILTRFCPKPSV